MTIKGVLRNGVIEPTEPIPPGWDDGREVIIEDSDSGDDASQIANWAREMNAIAERVPAEDDERLSKAIAEIEQESKAAVRRECDSRTTHTRRFALRS